MPNWLPADPETRTQMRNAVFVSVIAVAALIFIPPEYTGNLIGIQGLYKQRTQLETELQAAIDKLREYKDIVAKEEELLAELNRLEPKIAYYESRLPNTEGMPELLRELDLIANRTGLTFTKHTPGEPQETGPIKELPYHIEMFSDYHSFGNFLNELENAERFAKVDNVSIEYVKDSVGRHRVSLTLSTFMFNEDHFAKEGGGAGS